MDEHGNITYLVQSEIIPDAEITISETEDGGTRFFVVEGELENELVFLRMVKYIWMERKLSFHQKQMIPLVRLHQGRVGQRTRKTLSKGRLLTTTYTVVPRPAI